MKMIGDGTRQHLRARQCKSKSQITQAKRSRHSHIGRVCPVYRAVVARIKDWKISHRNAVLQWASGAEFDHVNLLAVQTDCVVTRFPFFGLGRVSVLMTRHTLPLSEGFFWQQSVLLVVPPAAVHATRAWRPCALFSWWTRRAVHRLRLRERCFSCRAGAPRSFIKSKQSARRDIYHQQLVAHDSESVCATRFEAARPSPFSTSEGT